MLWCVQRIFVQLPSTQEAGAKAKGRDQKAYSALPIARKESTQGGEDGRTWVAPTFPSMPDLKKRPPKLDPAGRYKGTNYDPDYARKKYGPTAGRRDKGASNLWGQNDDPGYSPYDAGIQTGYRPNTGPGYYGNTGYSNGGSAISGAASSQGGGSFNPPHLDSQGHSDPAGVQIKFEAIYGVRNSTPSIPSSSGISMDLRSQYSPSQWASSHGNAQTGDGSAPIVPSTHDRYSPVASTATGRAGPSSSAVPANPGHAHSSSVGEISSLEKLKQFKAQVEASRLARANAKPDSSVAQAAETYLQSVNTSANATQAAQTQSPTTTTSATNSGPSAQQTEEGETRESRALALKERLRQKIEERKNSVSTGTRTPEPLIAADRPPSSVGAAPANGAPVRAPQNSRETWTPSAPSCEASSRAPFQQTASPHSPTLPTQHHDTPQRTSKDVVSPAQQAVQAQYQTSPQQVHPHRQALVSSPTKTTEPLLGHSEAQSYAQAEWEPQRAPDSVSSVAEDVAGRYIEAARKRQEARERVIDSQRRRSLSPRSYHAQRHQSPTSSVPQDHYHWGHPRREKSPVRRPSLADRREYHDARRDEPADRYGTHASPHNGRQDRYAETPPHLSLSSHQPAYVLQQQCADI